jgi:hypothetical protein
MFHRRGIYINFKRSCFEKYNLISKDTLGLSRVIHAIRSVPDAPSYLSYPRFLVKESWPVLDGNSNRIIVYKKSQNYSRSIWDLRGSIASNIESILSKRWHYRSDPFVFHEIWKRRKSGYLLSDEKIPSILGDTGTLPEDFRAFCPNAKLFAREIAVRTKSIPISFWADSHTRSDFSMYLLKDAYELCLPTDLIGEWREIKELYSKNFYILRNILSGYNLINREEHKAFLYAAKSFFEEELRDKVPDRLSNRYSQDIMLVLERFEDEKVYTRLISREYTVEDLLSDEEAFASLRQSDDESEQLHLEDYEIFEDDGSEFEDENPGLNEIRRIARQGDAPDIFDFV